MLKKIIKYKDFNDVDREDVFFFNLTTAEIAEMEIMQESGLQNYIKSIIESKKNSEIFKLFKELIIRSYGEKSDDGKRFIKTDKNGEPLYKSFIESQAYSELLMDFITRTDSAVEFVNGIMPSNLNEKTLKEAKEKIENN